MAIGVSALAEQPEFGALIGRTEFGALIGRTEFGALIGRTEFRALVECSILRALAERWTGMIDHTRWLITPAIEHRTRDALFSRSDNGTHHRAAARDLQANEKANHRRSGACDGYP